MTVALEVAGLTASRGRDRVLHGVDLTLAEGEVTALLGPNGAGKSTLLAALAGLVDRKVAWFAHTGRIAAALQEPGMARRSALANVELAMSWWGVPRRGRRQRAMAALSALRADHLAGRRATLLSGGEQRRVHLARAIALDADVLLLDEPFAGLDGESRASLLDDAASALRGRRGATLFVAHDRAEAWALADRLVVLMDGRVVASGAPDALLDAPPSLEVARFLGYDGELVRGGEIVVTRHVHVTLDPAGERATVESLTRLEDGCRVRLSLPGGIVHAIVPSATVGDSLTVRIDERVRFPR